MGKINKRKKCLTTVNGTNGFRIFSHLDVEVKEKLIAKKYQIILT